MPERVSETAVRAAHDLRVLIGRLRRRVKEAGGDGELTPSQESVVRRLDREGPLSASDLAAAERVRPQSMAAVLAALDERGWIERQPDPHDGRKQLLSLTAAALKDLRDWRRLREEWLARALQDRYTHDERKTITEALALLYRITEP
ncbi:MarR family winged helix-turn-helix transcriptional regulator [Amycolatopsis minnesotensis]|uniref:MarR family transcriptional regulator n=1 Tax=Amycolatopsis minnesotensis TaxID=337894 RepID=A0ABN2REA4_9PSEU